MKDYLKTFANGESVIQVIKVGLIGVANTVVSIALFRILLAIMGGEASRTSGWDLRLFAATAIAFALTTLMSYSLNRSWTFDLDGATGTKSETAKFFALNGIAWFVTQAVVLGANWIWGPLSDNMATVAYVGAALLIILPKFAGYRDLVFRSSLDAKPTEASRTTR